MPTDPSRLRTEILQWTLVLLGILLMSGLMISRCLGALDSDALTLAGLIAGILLIVIGLCFVGHKRSSSERTEE